jgi:drug/metabolite transporter (DMT)-like permease
VTLHLQLAAAGFSLVTAMFWGSSDFIGGYAVKRNNAFVFTLIAHASGSLFLSAVAWLSGSPFPSREALGWCAAAGSFAGLALVAFYSALAAGKMGLNAPLAAVLSAAIPAVVGMTTEGLPGALPVAGFLLAGAGIGLISSAEGGGRPKGLGLAVVAGLGFAGYFLCTRQAGQGSALWIAGLARCASFVITAIVVLLKGNFVRISGQGVALGVLAGCVDVSGSYFFVRAMQSGRLDTAVVLTSLYPAVTVVLASLLLQERFTGWKMIGMIAAILAVPLIALQ